MFLIFFYVCVCAGWDCFLLLLQEQLLVHQYIGSRFFCPTEQVGDQVESMVLNTKEAMQNLVTSSEVRGECCFIFGGRDFP